MVLGPENTLVLVWCIRYLNNFICYLHYLGHRLSCFNKGTSKILRVLYYAHRYCESGTGTGQSRGGLLCSKMPGALAGKTGRSGGIQIIMSRNYLEASLLTHLCGAVHLHMASPWSLGPTQQGSWVATWCWASWEPGKNHMASSGHDLEVIWCHFCHTSMVDEVTRASEGRDRDSTFLRLCFRTVTRYLNKLTLQRWAFQDWGWLFCLQPMVSKVSPIFTFF